jgi:hypothetical protein
MKIFFSFLIMASVSPMAFASAISIDNSRNDREGAVVKRVFLRQANDEHSLIHKSLLEKPEIELDFTPLPAFAVSVVPQSTFDYAGRDEVEHPSFDGIYLVFVGYQSNGRGSIGGSLQFSCRLAYDNEALHDSDVHCSEKFIDLGAK